MKVSNDSDHIQYMAVSDMQIIIDYTLNIQTHPLQDVHKELIDEKDKILTKYGFTASEIKKGNVSLPIADVQTLTESLNALSVNFQDELKKKIGTDAYVSLNGDDKFYLPINPDIAIAALGRK